MFDKKEEAQKRYDRIKGALWGVAVGDCLGAPVEFMDAQSIYHQYGLVTEILGGGWLGALAGRGTDDTAMTLAVAEGLMKTGPLDDAVEKIGVEFIKWFYDAPIGAGAACARSIGIASKNGRVKAPKRSTWLKAAEMAHYDLGGRSGGNGSLMRTAPVALFLKADNKGLAFDISRMTHFDDDAGIACMIYCDILRALIRGYSLQAALDKGTARTEYKTVTRTENRFTPHPGGYVKDTFNTVLWGITRTDNFRDALIRVVNLGGDADTTGAIVGGLAGAAYGYSAIPQSWVDAIDPMLALRLNKCADAAARIWHCVPD